jgi:hypothetical protein
MAIALGPVDEIMTMALDDEAIAACPKAPADAIRAASAMPSRIVQVIFILSPAPQ